MKKVLVITVSLIMIYSVMNGAFVYNRHTGAEINSFTARSLGMGSTGIVAKKGILNAFKNPAILCLLNKKYGGQFSFSLSKYDEDRSFPIYDSFDSYIDDAVYVSNAHFFEKYMGGLFYNFGLGHINFAAAFNFAPIYDFNLKYSEEVRNNENTDNNNEPKKIAINTLKSKGKIYSYSPTLAISIDKPTNFVNLISLGIRFSFLTGENTLDSTIIFTEWAKEKMINDPDSIPDVNYSLKNKYSGFNIQGGLNIDIGKRIDLGFSYETKAHLTKKYKTNTDTTWSEKTIYYPSKFGIGFEYHPRNRWDTKLNIEAKYVKWSDFNSLYDDVIEYYAGLEHKIVNSVPLRLGFCYLPSGKNEEVTLTIFSAGTSLNLPYNTTLDLGIEMGNMNYMHKDLFPDGYYANENLWDTTYDDLPENRTNPDNIQDFMVNTIATITWEF